MLLYIKINTDDFPFNDCTTYNTHNIKSIVPLIGNLANREHTLFMKKCLCQETNDEFNKFFQVLEHKYATRNKSKSIKLPQFKLEVSKQGFYFSGSVLYNSLPIATRSIEPYDKFKELILSAK